jgi:hypothetical protein
MWPIVMFAVAIVAAMIGFWYQARDKFRDVDEMKFKVEKHDREISGLCGRIRPQINRSEL